MLSKQWKQAWTWKKNGEESHGEEMVTINDIAKQLGVAKKYRFQDI